MILLLHVLLLSTRIAHAADDSTELQAAITAAASGQTAGVIEFSNRSYTLATTLHIPANSHLTFRGAGIGASVLEFSGRGTAIALHEDGNSEVLFTDFSLVGSGHAAGGIISRGPLGVDGSANWLTIERCAITGFTRPAHTTMVTYVETSAHVVVTAPGHGLAEGDVVSFRGLRGTTELNGHRYHVGLNVSADSFTLFDGSRPGEPIDGSAFGAYSGGGVMVAFTSRTWAVFSEQDYRTRIIESTISGNSNGVMISHGMYGASVEHSRVWMNTEQQLHLQGNAGNNIIGNMFDAANGGSADQLVQLEDSPGALVIGNMFDDRGSALPENATVMLRLTKFAQTYGLQGLLLAGNKWERVAGYAGTLPLVEITRAVTNVEISGNSFLVRSTTSPVSVRAVEGSRVKDLHASYNRVGITTTKPTGPVPQFNLSDHTAHQTLGISEQYHYEDTSVHVMRNASVHLESLQAERLQCTGTTHQRDLCKEDTEQQQQQLLALQQTVAEQAKRLAVLEELVGSLRNTSNDL